MRLQKTLRFMSRSTTTPTHAANQQVFTINWKLLLRRLRLRSGQLFSSARHRAAQTEYIPPSWASQLRLTWFRLGLIAVLAFVFTQKQIDFTVTVGGGEDTLGEYTEDGGANPGSQTTQLSMLPTGATVASKPTWSVNTLDETAVNAYINRFARVAQTEEEKYQIPAAAKLAMAILESDAGQATAAIQDNNHFAASLPAEYYDNAWTSWRTHSQQLEQRYPSLANESVNYQQWIAALCKTDYSRDTAYGQKLLDIIERFGLDRI